MGNYLNSKYLNDEENKLYKYSISETINNIDIIEDEFARLLSYINK